MSKQITDWVKEELYPSLYERMDQALPEMDFKRWGGGWRSPLKLDGSRPKHPRRDKTVVTRRAPGVILEQGGETFTIVDFVMRRDRVDFIQAVKTLADIVGLQLPESNSFDPEKYQKQKTQITIMEDCNSYFTYCLETASGDGAQEIRDYLSFRGYTQEDIKEMELGYIPSQDKLYSYLEKRAYSKNEIEDTVKLNKAIGDTHRLTIPYRSGGSVKGFKFRTIGAHSPKYINSTGLDRSGGFFNLSPLKGDKDLVIVEGELDSLFATVKGVGNVVATGGSSINSDQVKDALRKGAKTFTLCFDKETGKEEETYKRVTAATEIILSEGVNSVYIVNIPSLTGDKTDPDSLIREKGVGVFKEAIKNALPWYVYQVNSTIDTLSKDGELTHKSIEKLLEEIVKIGLRLTPLERDVFKKQVLNLRSLGITEESLSITLDQLTAKRDKELQAQEFKALLSQATDLHSKGDVDKALELLGGRLNDVKLKDKSTEFSSLLKPLSEEEIRDRQANKPDSLNSGYTIGDEELLLPSGALSIFAAPTSHGKTTLLLNLAINGALSYPDKEFYFFSYEEDGDTILMNSLNIYIGEELSKRNRGAIREYFCTGSTQYIKSERKELFLSKKSEFFSTLIEPRRLNINYSSYNSDTLIEAIRYINKHGSPGAVFIDYIQLLNLPDGKYKTYSRQEEIKQICIGLKDVAVETGLPLILGAQFNREVINLLRLHPTKIGEAGDIERIANVIVGFWNCNFEPLGTDGEINDIDKKGAQHPNTLYTTILKNRGGKVGSAENLLFDGNTGKIKNNSFMRDLL